MAKKVEKQPKKGGAKKTTEEPEKTPQVNKQSKKNESTELDLLPESLQTRFQEFSDLYQEINRSIAESGKGDSFDVIQRQTDLAQKIQDAITEVFKSEISSAEEEIRNTQKDIQNQIESLENSYDKVRGILEETKAFSGEEITSTLAVLEGKVNDKKASLQTHQELLDKAREAYA